MTTLAQRLMVNGRFEGNADTHLCLVTNRFDAIAEPPGHVCVLPPSNSWIAAQRLSLTLGGFSMCLTQWSVTGLT